MCCQIVILHVRHSFARNVRLLYPRKKKEDSVCIGVKTNTHTSLLVSAAGSSSSSASCHVQLQMGMWKDVRALSLLINHCFNSMDHFMLKASHHYIWKKVAYYTVCMQRSNISTTLWIWCQFTTLSHKYLINEIVCTDIAEDCTDFHCHLNFPLAQI